MNMGLKKTLKHFVGIGASVYILLVKLPILDGLDKDIQLIIDSILVVAIIFNYILNTQNPEKKYENAQAVRRGLLKKEADAIIAEFKVKGYEVKFNFMVEKRYKKITHLYPDQNGKGRLIFFPRIFVDIFTWPDNYHLPEKFLLGIRQGSNGIARKNGSTEIVNLTDFKKYEDFRNVLNLNREQYEVTKGVKLLVSTQIKTKKADGTGEKSIELGILTMESNSIELAQMAKMDLKTIIIPDDEENKKEVLASKAKVEEMQKMITKAMSELSNTYIEFYF